MYRAWQERRLVVTKECLSFAFVGMDDEIDRIPLAGVDYVEPYDENETMERDIAQSHQYYCLQVGTNISGYNSGRVYNFRTKSKEIYDEILPQVRKLSLDARTRAEATTAFRNNQLVQLKVRKIYDHNLCQGLIACIISGVGVNILSLPTFRVHHSKMSSFTWLG